MAMTTCKECKKEVSDSAKVCPHCGVKKPGERWWHALAGLAVVIVVGTGLYWYFGDDEATPAKTVAAKECKANDSTCIFEKNWIQVSKLCRPIIEKSSKYEFEWADGMFTPMFSHSQYKQSKNTMTFIGDKVKFTNGFNAKTTMTYYCTYDLKNKELVDFKIENGKL
ncbi:MAG: hypothetical protein ACTH5S_12325 [Hafnia alvei]|uniref:hypothetical protein n=1 Tax=Hafnia alvei TaxID=569 RepID=UPI003F92DF28